MVVEYGIMSNKWSIEADNKLTAYAYGYKWKYKNT